MFGRVVLCAPARYCMVNWWESSSAEVGVSLRNLFGRSSSRNEQIPDRAGPSGVDAPPASETASTTAPTDLAPSADATAGEFLFGDGGAVSVSCEEHYQDTLSRIRGPMTAREVVATLSLSADGNPWTRKPTGPVITVSVDNQTVGFLTPAMTARYGPLVDQATAAGHSLTANALVSVGTGSKGRDIEITLNAVPVLHNQSHIDRRNIETRPEYVLVHRSGFAHILESEQSDGWRVKCGEQLASPHAEVIFTTKPWVGRVRADGQLFDGWPLWCNECRPDRASVESGGRFGDSTSIRGGHRFSAAMTPDAIAQALRDRLDFDAAGESFRPGYPETLLRCAEVLREMRPGERLPVVLRRDPTNEYDANAIEIHIPGEAGHVGFVPAELAQLLAPILDSGERLHSSAVEVRIRENAPDRPGLTVTLRRVAEG